MNPPAPSTPRRIPWLRWLLVLGVIMALLPLFSAAGLLRQALDWIDRLGPWGPALFILIYIVATVLLVPGSALTFGAGALFGVVRGSLYVSVASTIGATCAFLIGRHLARDAVTRWIENHPTFSAIDQAVGDEGWKIVGLTRLSPVFPFTLLNYAFGLSRVSLRDYVLASWAGMVPGTVMYVYLGSLANAAAGQRSHTPLEWTLYAVGLLATVGVTIFLTQLARKTLAKKIPNSPRS